MSVADPVEPGAYALAGPSSSAALVRPPSDAELASYPGITVALTVTGQDPAPMLAALAPHNGGQVQYPTGTGAWYDIRAWLQTDAQTLILYGEPVRVVPAMPEGHVLGKVLAYGPNEFGETVFGDVFTGPCRLAALTPEDAAAQGAPGATARFRFLAKLPILGNPVICCYPADSATVANIYQYGYAMIRRVVTGPDDVLYCGPGQLVRAPALPPVAAMGDPGHVGVSVWAASVDSPVWPLEGGTAEPQTAVQIRVLPFPPVIRSAPTAADLAAAPTADAVFVTSVVSPLLPLPSGWLTWGLPPAGYGFDILAETVVSPVERRWLCRTTGHVGLIPVRVTVRQQNAGGALVDLATNQSGTLESGAGAPGSEKVPPAHLEGRASYTLPPVAGLALGPVPPSGAGRVVVRQQNADVPVSSIAETDPPGALWRYFTTGMVARSPHVIRWRTEGEPYKYAFVRLMNLGVLYLELSVAAYHRAPEDPAGVVYTWVWPTADTPALPPTANLRIVMDSVIYTAGVVALLAGGWTRVTGTQPPTLQSPSMVYARWVRNKGSADPWVYDTTWNPSAGTTPGEVWEPVKNAAVLALEPTAGRELDSVGALIPAGPTKEYLYSDSESSWWLVTQVVTTAAGALDFYPATVTAERGPAPVLWTGPTKIWYRTKSTSNPWTLVNSLGNYCAPPQSQVLAQYPTATLVLWNNFIGQQQDQPTRDYKTLFRGKYYDLMGNAAGPLNPAVLTPPFPNGGDTSWWGNPYIEGGPPI